MTKYPNHWIPWLVTTVCDLTEFALDTTPLEERDQEALLDLDYRNRKYVNEIWLPESVG